MRTGNYSDRAEGAPLLSLSGCARCFPSGVPRLVCVDIERRASRRRYVIRRAASLSESSAASQQMALRAGMRRDAPNSVKGYHRDQLCAYDLYARKL